MEITLDDLLVLEPRLAWRAGGPTRRKGELMRAESFRGLFPHARPRRICPCFAAVRLCLFRRERPRSSAGLAGTLA